MSYLYHISFICNVYSPMRYGSFSLLIHFLQLQNCAQTNTFYYFCKFAILPENFMRDVKNASTFTYVTCVGSFFSVYILLFCSKYKSYTIQYYVYIQSISNCYIFSKPGECLFATRHFEKMQRTHL